MCLPYICPCYFSWSVQFTVSICRFLFLMVLVRVSFVFCLYFLHLSTVVCTFLLLLPSFLFVSCSFLPFSSSLSLRRLTRSFVNGCYGFFMSIFFSFGSHSASTLVCSCSCQLWSKTWWIFVRLCSCEVTVWERGWDRLLFWSIFVLDILTQSFLNWSSMQRLLVELSLMTPRGNNIWMAKYFCFGEWVYACGFSASVFPLMFAHNKDLLHTIWELNEMLYKKWQGVV